MPSYKAPVADTMSLLTDVFGLHRYENLPRFADAQIDVVEAVLSEGGKLAEEVLQPLNLSGDQEGCRRLPDGSVVTPKGFREAYKAYVEGGWVGIAGSPAYGGQGLPHFLSVALKMPFVLDASVAACTESDTAAFLRGLVRLRVTLDRFPKEGDVLALARHRGLTVYDAAYLELARREGAPLATLDAALATAARAERVPLLSEPRQSG